MRKMILLGLLAASAVPSIANAQSMGNVRDDRREIRDDRRDSRDDRRDIRHDRRDDRRDRRDWRGDHGRVAYVAPYGGWSYRPINPGFQLRPLFWGQQYVVSDYGRYNLGAPRFNQRWVRYGNDLVLVNVRNGRVLQVIRDRY